MKVIFRYVPIFLSLLFIISCGDNGTTTANPGGGTNPGGGGVTPPTENVVADFTAEFSDSLIVTFTDSSVATNTTIQSRSWSFGDNGTSAEQNPTHTYPKLGDYNVTLTVTDTNGKTFTKSKLLSVAGTKLFAGEAFTVAISPTSKLYAFGNNEYGQLGLGSYDNKSTPEAIPFFNNIKIKSAATGFYHALAVATTGEVYAWGDNLDGQLGLGTATAKYNTPQRIAFFNDKDVTTVYAFRYQSFAITADGKVYAWGDNANGQLGVGDNDDSNIPKEITFLADKRVVKLTGGFQHVLALTADGKLYAWGSNYDGELGLGDNSNYNTPQHVTFFNSDAVKSVTSGDLFNLALTASGKLYSWGSNRDGRLGVAFPDKSNIPIEITSFNAREVKYISSAGGRSLATTTDGSVYVWGLNSQGQLGLGHQANETIPTYLNFFDFLADVYSAYFGYFFGFVVLEDGTIYCWGIAGSGELGFESETTKLSPVLFPTKLN